MRRAARRSALRAFRAREYFLTAALTNPSLCDPWAVMMRLTSRSGTFAWSNCENRSVRLCKNENPAPCKIGIAPIPARTTVTVWPAWAFVTRFEGKPTLSEQFLLGVAIGIVVKLLATPPERTAIGTKHPSGTVDGTWNTI